jgi:hypothetical protein
MVFLMHAPACGVAAEPIAVFDFALVDTSPAPPSAAERARLAALGEELRARLAQSGRYRIVAIAPLASALAASPDIMNCNGCEREFAKQLGAQAAAYGWVQKVSDLILNINVVIEEVASGRRVAAGSVDIRGNTDESWRRGLDYLIEERLLPNP